MRSTRSAMVAGVCLVACGAARGEGGDFTLDVRPILEKYCFSCHGMSKPKAGVNVAQYETVDAVQRDPDQWLDIIEAMRERLMPPSDAELQPSEEERELVIAGVERVLAAMESRDPGRQMIHRLTRAEYNNTVRDLLGVSSRPADVFPADGGGGEGFDNNSSTLFIPPILMERYLAAAEAVIEEADPTRYLIAEPGQEMTEEQAARVCIEGFARRAFRRPVEPGEVDRYMTLWRAASDRGDGFGEAVKLAMRGVMVSPNFLFRVEHDRQGTEPYRISDWELAVGSSRVDLQACKLEYSIVSPK